MHIHDRSSVVVLRHRIAGALRHLRAPNLPPAVAWLFNEYNRTRIDFGSLLRRQR